MTTILLVEDEEQQTQLYEEELREAGYEVLLARDGGEARESQVDLVVLDMELPDTDGIEVLTKMLSRSISIPVIIHTAHHEHRDKFITWTAEHYIVKSSDLSNLKAKIRESLEFRTRTTS